MRLPEKTCNQCFESSVREPGRYVFYLVSEYAKRIHIARFGGIRPGRPERFRIHQFRGAATRQLMRVLRPGGGGGLPANRTQTRYARCILGVDQNVYLQECRRGCEHVTG